MVSPPLPTEVVSKTFPKTAAEADLLKPVIVDLLRTIPETWTECDPNETSSKERAASLLVAAGMVERRGLFRAYFTNHPVCFEVRWEATGESGYTEVVERVSAAEYATWGDAWRAWKAGETGHVSPVHTEHLKPQEWRLTDQGMRARKELESDVNDVLDFVLKRGPYGAGYYVRKYLQDRALVRDDKELLVRYTAAGFDWKLLPRLPLRGYGRVIEVRQIENPTGPQAVKLTNWAEGGDAFAAAFDKVLGPMFDAMSKNQQANASPSVTSPAAKKKQGGAGSAPKKARSTKTPTIPILSERQYNILQAMLELGATAVQDRFTTEKIALKAEGSGTSPEQFKRPMSDLKKRKLVDSQDGRDGGSWLTDNGRTVAGLIKNKRDTKQ